MKPEFPTEVRWRSSALVECSIMSAMFWLSLLMARDPIVTAAGFAEETAVGEGVNEDSDVGHVLPFVNTDSMGVSGSQGAEMVFKFAAMAFLVIL
jgi:hypothetical protein